MIKKYILLFLLCFSVSANAQDIWKPGGGGGSGDVTGPASSTDGNLPSFDGTGGKTLQDSGKSAADVVTGPASSTDDNIPTFSGAGGKIIQDSGVGIGDLLPGACSTDNAVILWDAGGSAADCSSAITFDGTTLLLNKAYGSEETFADFQDSGTSRIKFVNGDGGAAGQIHFGSFGKINALGGGALEVISGTNFFLRLRSQGTGDLILQPGDVIDLQGPTQLDVSTLTISSGAVTATKTYHILNGEGASADTLTDINGDEQGDLVCVERGDADITLDCVSGAGNLTCPGAAADIVLGDGQVHCFINNGTNWTSLTYANP